MSQIEESVVEDFDFPEEAPNLVEEELPSNSEDSLPQATEQPVQEGAYTQEAEAATEPVGEASDFADEEALRQRVVELTSELTQLKNAQIEQAPPIPAMPEGTKLPEAGTTTDINFLQGLEGDAYVDMLETPEKFNKLLNTVATTTYVAAMNAAQENIMRRIPDIVATSINQQQYIHSTTAKFYEKNADLTAYKPAVAMAATQIYNEQPNLSLPDLLKKAGERTREMLRIRPNSQRKRMPAQPAGSNVIGGVDRTAGAPALSDQEIQILALLKD